MVIRQATLPLEVWCSELTRVSSVVFQTRPTLSFPKNSRKRANDERTLQFRCALPRLNDHVRVSQGTLQFEERVCGRITPSPYE